MIEELKVIAEIFKTTTDTVLYAYLSFIMYKLAHTSNIVFPIYGAVKLFISKAFIYETTKD